MNFTYSVYYILSRFFTTKPDKICASENTPTHIINCENFYILIENPSSTIRVFEGEEKTKFKEFAGRNLSFKFNYDEEMSVSIYLSENQNEISLTSPDKKCSIKSYPPIGKMSNISYKAVTPISAQFVMNENVSILLFKYAFELNYIVKTVNCNLLKIINRTTHEIKEIELDDFELIFKANGVLDIKKKETADKLIISFSNTKITNIFIRGNSSEHDIALFSQMDVELIFEYLKGTNASFLLKSDYMATENHGNNDIDEFEEIEGLSNLKTYNEKPESESDEKFEQEINKFLNNNALLFENSEPIDANAVDNNNMIQENKVNANLESLKITDYKGKKDYLHLLWIENYDEPNKDE